MNFFKFRVFEKRVTHGRTEGPTDGPTDIRTKPLNELHFSTKNRNNRKEVAMGIEMVVS